MGGTGRQDQSPQGLLSPLAALMTKCHDNRKMGPNLHWFIYHNGGSGQFTFATAVLSLLLCSHVASPTTALLCDPPKVLCTVAHFIWKATGCKSVKLVESAHKRNLTNETMN